MSIINQKYTKIIKKSIENALKKEIQLKQIDNYLDFINYLDGFLLEIIKQSIKSTFELIDLEYKNSKRRKMLYYTKGKYKRTIMTLFGEVSFEREYYVPKGSNNDGFFYIDNLFSLPKRDYYDPMIKAYIIELSAKYSYIQTGQLIGDKIGERFKNLIQNKLASISRQTVYNVIKKADMSYLLEDSLDDVDTIYIQMDEKWVHTQGNNRKKTEIKAAVIYTGIKEVYRGRKKLINRYVITSSKSASNLRQKILDYISKTYNVDKIKNIIVSGDGAKWIKMSLLDIKIQKSINACFILDRFHMYQAINHISKDENIKKYLRDYLTFKNSNNFKMLCNTLITENKDREDIIAKNRDYLVSNWKHIQNQSNPLFKGCSMEGHVSHVLASLFTSRPKAHSLHMISKRLKIRELYINNLDLKNIYLSNHTNSYPDSSLINLDDKYYSIQDIIGYKVNSKYRWYKSITHSSIFS